MSPNSELNKIRKHYDFVTVTSNSYAEFSMHIGLHTQPIECIYTE